MISNLCASYYTLDSQFFILFWIRREEKDNKKRSIETLDDMDLQWINSGAVISTSSTPFPLFWIKRETSVDSGDGEAKTRRESRLHEVDEELSDYGDNNFWRRAQMDGNRSEMRMKEPVERRKLLSDFQVGICAPRGAQIPIYQNFRVIERLVWQPFFEIVLSFKENIQWCEITDPQLMKVTDILDFTVVWGNCPKKRNTLNMVIYSTLWNIWLARNNKLFNKIGAAPTKIADEIIDRSFEWQKYRGKRTGSWAEWRTVKW
ncbi:hypothetical protein LXL04_026350 [Taraxacum kok-saghyz]